MLFVRDFLEDQSILRSLSAPAEPTISIILPTYARYASGLLERAIRSILAQSFDDYELIVVDDGSTDGSSEFIENLRSSDSRIIHLRHERNSGLPGLRVNEGIGIARGRYLAFQFDDDCWRVNALSTLLEKATSLPESGVVVGRCHARDSNCEVVHPRWDLNLSNLYRDNSICNNSVLFPKQLVNLVGMYDCHIGMRRVCDWDLWQRLIKYVPFTVTDEIVTDVYAHKPDSVAMTMPYDLAVIRWFQSVPRDHLLTPSQWQNYQVDALRIGEYEIHGELRRRLYENQLVPFYQKFRHRFPEFEGLGTQVPYSPKTVLCTKIHYETTRGSALTTASLDALSNRRGNFKLHYQSLAEISLSWPQRADILLLMMERDHKANELTHLALRERKPVALYLQDNWVKNELQTEPFAIEFETQVSRSFRDTLANVDAVLCGDSLLCEMLKSTNPRIIGFRGCVPQELLPQNVHPYSSQRPKRIACVGQYGTNDQFDFFWEAIKRILQELPGQVQFITWNMGKSSIPPEMLANFQNWEDKDHHRSIQHFADQQVDILAVPLQTSSSFSQDDDCLSRYCQAAIAGALGVFSDIPSTAQLPSSTCFKSANNPNDWYETLRDAILMPRQQFDLMRERLLEHVREEYTETNQIYLYEAGLRATEFHAKTRQYRLDNGCPRIAYFLHSPYFGGGELQLWRRLRLARNYGIEPIITLPQHTQHTDDAQRICKKLENEQIRVEFIDYDCFVTPYHPSDYFSESQRKDIIRFLEYYRPALVHSVTFIPSLGQVCQELNIPHVVSLYAIDDNFVWSKQFPPFKHADIVQSDCVRYTKRWSKLLGVEGFCAREVVPEQVFALGQQKYLEHLDTDVSISSQAIRLVVSGTIQERKRQLETIEAVGRLKQEGFEFQLDIFGYTHFFPEYIEKCQQAIHDDHLEGSVRFRGFRNDNTEILRDADIVLSLSTFESFPSAIKEAMAAGVLVVATPVGGIPELIIDGVSGILCANTTVEAMTDGIRRAFQLNPVERRRIVEQARRVARSEFHPQRAINDLLTMYNRALDAVRQSAIPVQAADQTRKTIAASLEMTDAPSGEPRRLVNLNDKVEFTILPKRDKWQGLNIKALISRPISGKIKLRVYSSSGYFVREADAELALLDGDWIGFKFAPITNSWDRRFIVRFVLDDYGKQPPISFYEADVSHESGANALFCQMHYSIE